MNIKSSAVYKKLDLFSLRIVLAPDLQGLCNLFIPVAFNMLMVCKEPASLTGGRIAFAVYFEKVSAICDLALALSSFSGKNFVDPAVACHELAGLDQLLFHVRSLAELPSLALSILLDRIRPLVVF